MNRILGMLSIGLLTTALAVAQPAPPGEGPRDGEGDRHPSGRDDQPGPGGREGARQPGPHRPGPGPTRHNEARPQDGRGTESRPPRPGPLEAMRTYLELINHYARVSGDSTTSGIAAVLQTADILRPRGPQVVIDHFEKLLPEVKNPAVARAIRFQLVDLYRQTQQSDKAVEQLTELIRSTPSANPVPGTTP